MSNRDINNEDYKEIMESIDKVGNILEKLTIRVTSGLATPELITQQLSNLKSEVNKLKINITYSNIKGVSDYDKIGRMNFCSNCGDKLDWSISTNTNTNTTNDDEYDDQLDLSNDMINDNY